MIHFIKDQALIVFHIPEQLYLQENNAYWVKPDCF